MIVSASSFEAFKIELHTLFRLLGDVTNRTVRDEDLRARFQVLFRVWASSVEPEIRSHLQNKRDLFKLSAELEALAKLTTKYKQVVDYKKRLKKAIQLAESLVIYLPPSTTGDSRVAGPGRAELFLKQIPDLPLSLVPNPILGWRTRLENFLLKYPFDKSVFIMILYRPRNEALIKAIKTSLREEDLTGVLASEHSITDDLYNPIACLLCCAKGIAIFDRAEGGETFNPNVAYELGMLHLLGRPCLILKHESLKALQTDILMKLYTPYRSAAEAAKSTLVWSRSG